MKSLKNLHVFVFRHGETDWNTEGRIQGHLDIPLNELGRSQAKRLCAPLRSLGIEAVLSSDLSRALETSHIATEGSGIAVHPDPRLREMHFGRLQGLNREQIAREFGAEYSHGLAHRPLSDEEILVLGIEKAEDVFKRATDAVTEFIARTGHERIAVSSHGGLIRRILLNAEGCGGFPPGIPNSVVFPFTFDLEPVRWVAEDRIPWAGSVGETRSKPPLDR